MDVDCQLSVSPNILHARWKKDTSVNWVVEGKKKRPLSTRGSRIICRKLLYVSSVDYVCMAYVSNNNLHRL